MSVLVLGHPFLFSFEVGSIPGGCFCWILTRTEMSDIRKFFAKKQKLDSQSGVGSRSGRLSGSLSAEPSGSRSEEPSDSRSEEPSDCRSEELGDSRSEEPSGGRSVVPSENRVGEFRGGGSDESRLTAPGAEIFASATSTNFVPPSVNGLDIGLFLSKSSLSDSLKYNVLLKAWKPDRLYNFKNDLASDGGKRRPFLYNWLDEFHFIAYSSQLKGALCKFCVLFPPRVDRGVQGSFIKTPFTKYKNFREAVKTHSQSKWHTSAMKDAMNFKAVMEGKQLSILMQIDHKVAETVRKNREILQSILKCVIFCGRFDLPMRGKTDERSLFRNLLEFRSDAGDSVLHNHLMTAPKNASYVSHRTQNDLVNICADIVKDELIKDLNQASAWSILADETADISGTEQLSIGVRFLKENTVREEFLGFVPLENLGAESVAKSIVKFIKENKLKATTLVGQGYDGCAVMAGREGGVQKILREEFPLANFFHCSSHRLNLVVNDLNAVADIRNTIGTIKECIHFFRDSPLRRKKLPNLPMLSETRWSAKYKSIRLFKDNFNKIIDALLDLKEDLRTSTRQKASQLLTCMTTSSFVVCVFIIARYSSLLEPVTNELQGVKQDLLSVKHQIDNILTIFRKHRENCDETFSELMSEVSAFCTEMNIDLNCPRIVGRQKNRSNIPADTPFNYYKLNVFIPYMDSLITSLENRFPSDNEAPFSLTFLHPARAGKLRKQEFMHKMKIVNDVYGTLLDNFLAEASLWFDVMTTFNPSEFSNQGSPEICLTQVVDHSSVTFYPAVQKALQIALALPPTTCTVERSFSTLRRVKTWLRSTMTDQRLSSLCILSIHRDVITKQIGVDSLIEKAINKYGMDNRRLQFLS